MYEGVELNKDKINFLELGPEFLVLEDINMDEVKAEFLTMVIKIRWERMGKEPEEIKRYPEVKEIEV